MPLCITSTCQPTVNAGIRRGLALLFGWTGGTFKNVRKHEEIWHNLGFDTLTSTTTLDETFLPPHGTDLGAKAEAMAMEIERHRERDRRSPKMPPGLIVPHIFSNGGALLFLETLDTVERISGRPLDYDGIVMDSVPSAPWSLRHPIVALSVLATSGLPLRDMAAASAVHVPYAVAAELALPFHGGVPPPPQSYHPRMRSLPRIVPELYLYSDADRLVSSKTGVEAHARHRRDVMGNKEVTLRKFDGSGHVSHYRTHPQEYADAIAAFVEKIRLRSRL